MSRTTTRKSVTDSETAAPMSHICASGKTSASTSVSLSRNVCVNSLRVCAMILFITVISSQ
jgi:hypothetical protein